MAASSGSNSPIVACSRCACRLRAVSTKGATCTLTLLDGEKPTQLTLKPAGTGAMVAKRKQAIGNDARGKISITFADKTTLSTAIVAK